MVGFKNVRQVVAATMVWALWFLTIGVAQATPEKAQYSMVLQQRLITLAASPTMLVAGDKLHSLSRVVSFYEQRNYIPAWSDGLRPTPQAQALAAAIASADKQGLVPTDYHLIAIRKLLAISTDTSETMVDRDLLLTDAYITYARNLAMGKTQPHRLFPKWNLQANDINTVCLLQQALVEKNVAGSLATLPPRNKDYRGLRQALAHYRKIKEAGGWPKIPAGPDLQLGTHSKRVQLLFQRLEISGDLHFTKVSSTPSDGPADTFNEFLEKAVKRFQSRMGIKDDGIVGRRTLTSLNVPVEVRIHQIIINMERLRWLPRRLGERYIMINIPAFTLTASERGNPVMSMRVIVGKDEPGKDKSGKDEPDYTTPVFTATMEYLVLNPYWYVPDKIAVREILPRLRNGTRLLARLHIRVLAGRGSDPQEINPASIDWADLDAQHFPYRLRQDPGPRNDLGNIKFVAPNPFDIYLHDTPYKGLFDARVRSLSHGCVRVERPVQLATFVLHGDSEWNDAQIRATIASGKRLVVHLPKPMPIYFLYRTAWVDAAGTHFRKDIYKRDRRLLAALQ